MTMEPKKELKKRIRSSDPVARMASLYLAQLDGLTIEAFWNEIETLANCEPRDYQTLRDELYSMLEEYTPGN
jgi:hypothetical protein